MSSRFSSPFMAKSPLNRRDKSKKEKRLEQKLEKRKVKEQTAWENEVD